MIRLIFTLCLLGQSAFADMVAPTHTIRANSIVTERDVQLIVGNRSDAFDRLEDVIGQEARVVLYPGRPILFSSVGPPALVERNQIVSVEFKRVGLTISAEGRALERGGVGDRIRIMNLTSRLTVFGYVQENGAVAVKP